MLRLAERTTIRGVTLGDGHHLHVRNQARLKLHNQFSLPPGVRSLKGCVVEIILLIPIFSTKLEIIQCFLRLSVPRTAPQITGRFSVCITPPFWSQKSNLFPSVCLIFTMLECF